MRYLVAVLLCRWKDTTLDDYQRAMVKRLSQERKYQVSSLLAKKESAL